jgi:hypothetical protein
MWSARTAVAAIVLAALLAAFTGRPLQAPTLAQARSCPVFPASFATNRRIDALPVALNSDRIIGSIGLSDRVHPDFGAGTYQDSPIGIPVQVVPRRTPSSRVSFDYADESDRVGYPIPAHPLIEGGADRHAILVDKDRCRLYELFGLRRVNGRWYAGSGATWNLRSSRLRPDGWTSADAAGLPILPLLARWYEVRRGRIPHALRVTVSRTRDSWVYPARHAASDFDDTDLPRMGERLRLKSSVSIRHLPPQARIIARAMKEYGLIVADNGSDLFVSGVPNPEWRNEELRALSSLEGRDFEVVDTTSLRRR